MSSLVTVRSLSVVLCFAGLALAQEPPPLEPPALEPPKTDAAQQPPPRAAQPPAARSQPNAGQPAAPRAPSRPMLAIPGVTAPAARSRPSNPPRATSPPPSGTSSASPFRQAPVSSSTGSPSLRTPSEPPAIPPREDLRESSAPDTIPLTLEPLTAEPDSDRAAPRSPAPRPGSARPPGPVPTEREVDEPSSPRPAPRRGLGVFSRFFGPLPPPPLRDQTRPPSRENSRLDRQTKEDPDAAARRRIERAIRETLGNRVRSIEVRVNGRNALIVAQPSRFWLRRAVRHSLETLPALQGYRTRIELGE
jgi:hypothetical protein